jgi:hypothetical protein
VEKGWCKGHEFLQSHGITFHSLAVIKQINDDNTMELE